MSSFSHVSHLLGRFPELAADSQLNQWLRKHAASQWHETEADGSGVLNVIVQSEDGLSMFAARLRRVLSGVDGLERHHVVLETKAFGPADIPLSPAQVVTAVLSTSFRAVKDVIAIRPVVNFGKTPAELGWEVEVADKAHARHFLLLPRTENLIETQRDFAPLRADDRDRGVALPANDWLASDECHHLDQWRSTAEQMIAGATSTADKARRIWSAVGAKMKYDATIRHISQFTHSDNLAISSYDWKGICDEWAVVQITLLRAVGIPATLKLLAWREGGDTVAHACLEWRDDAGWRHMDALWNIFDDSSNYRARGAVDVTVMDATHPLDRRSTSPAWGVPDTTGDQRFYPYGDFVISPSFPGNRRPGYSQ